MSNKCLKVKPCLGAGLAAWRGPGSHLPFSSCPSYPWATETAQWTWNLFLDSSLIDQCVHHTSFHWRQQKCTQASLDREEAATGTTQGIHSPWGREMWAVPGRARADSKASPSQAQAPSKTSQSPHAHLFLSPSCLYTGCWCIWAKQPLPNPSSAPHLHANPNS